MATATAAPVDTKNVEGRRKVRYESFDDLLADAERLAAVEVRTLGNWTYAQILDHLGKSIHAMIDGPGFSMPMPMRFVMRLLMKKKMLAETLPTGFEIPASGSKLLPPSGAEVEKALAALREAIARAVSTPERAPHPAFGRMGPGEWDTFQLRHCEAHMGFVVPTTA